MPPMGDNADARAEGLAAQQDAGEQQQDPNAGAQASLTAAADQNGTEAAAAEQADDAAGAQQNAADQPDDELATALGAFKSEVETLKAAIGVVGDRITALEAPAQREAIEAHMDEVVESFTAEVKTAMADLTGDVHAQLEALVGRVTALEASKEGQGAPADLTALGARIAELEAARQAAPPDAETVGRLVADLEGRLNSLVLKLRHML